MTMNQLRLRAKLVLDILWVPIVLVCTCALAYQGHAWAAALGGFMSALGIAGLLIAWACGFYNVDPE